MQTRPALGVLTLTVGLAVTGCSSGSHDAAPEHPASAAAGVVAAAPTSGTCGHFTPEVKDVRAKRSTLISAAAMKHYRLGSTVEDSKIALTRLRHGRSEISAAAPAPLDATALLKKVVRTWNATRPGGPAFPTFNLATTDDSLTLGATGTRKVTESPLVWYRGWRTLTGTFRWSTCGHDGRPLWGEGTFTALGVASSGGVACGTRSGSIDAVARAAVDLECG